MQFVMRYFWSNGILVGLANAFIMRTRVERKLKPGDQMMAPGRAIVRGAFISLGLLPLLLQVFQLLGGCDRPLFLFSRDFDNPFFILGNMSLILSWVLLGFWILAKDGAKAVAHFQLMSTQRETNESLVRLYVSLMLSGGVVALILGSVLDWYSQFSNLVNQM